MTNRKERRDLNGYIALYKPGYPGTYTDKNWNGYIYEHRYVAEQMLGRPLLATEVVHHLDCDKKNNSVNNLIILADKPSHARLHHWLDAGAPISQDYVPKVANHNHYSTLPKCGNPECVNIVATNDNDYCSRECFLKIARENIPPEQHLLTLLKLNSFVQVGKMFNVSDNAIRKWVKHYGHDPKVIRKQLQP